MLLKVRESFRSIPGLAIGKGQGPLTFTYAPWTSLHKHHLGHLNVHLCEGNSWTLGFTKFKQTDAFPLCP